MKESSDVWAVTVYRNGKCVVVIETNCLSGRDLLPGDEDVIRTAARHLLGFIGESAYGHDAPGEMSIPSTGDEPEDNGEERT